MKRWEYIRIRDYEDLDRLGKIGWELVSVTEGEPNHMVYYLKREVIRYSVPLGPN